MIDYLFYCYDVRIKRLERKYRNKKWAYIKVDSGGSYVAILLSILLFPIIASITGLLIGLFGDDSKWISILSLIIPMIPFFAMDHYFNKKEYHQRVYRKYKSKDIYILPMWILCLMYFVCVGLCILQIPLLDKILDPILGSKHIKTVSFTTPPNSTL